MKNLFSIRSGMGIQKRLLLLLLVVLVPLLLVQGFTYYQWFQERKEAEMRANLELARTVAKTFDAFVKEVLQTELAIGMAATASPALLLNDLRNILSQATKANPPLRNFSWVSPEGRVLASVNPEFENVDISKTDHYAKIRSGREWVVGDLITSQVTGRPVFTISRGIRDSKGNLLGIVAAVVLPDGLKEVLAVECPKDAAFSLVDSKGVHVYRYPAMGYTLEQSNWLKHYVLKGKEIAITVVSQVTGKKRLVGFASVSSMGWVAAASRGEDDVKEAITSALVSKAALFLLVALAVFGAAVALFRPIPITIGRLRDHALALGRGELEKLAVVSGPSELKDLAISINQMAEKVRLEAALRESEERFRIAEKVGKMGHFAWNVVKGSITVSPYLETIHGLEPGTFKGGFENWLAMVHPDDKKMIAEFIQQAFNQKLKEAAFDIRILRPNGEVRWVSVGVTATYDPSGCPLRVLGTMTDITERKRMEERLRQSEKSSKLLIKYAPSMICEIDFQGPVFKSVNDAMCDYLGYPRKELLAMNPFDLLDDEGKTVFGDRLNRILKGEIIKGPVEYKSKSKDGRELYAILNMTFNYKDGKPEGAVIVAHDVTERKRVEEEREKLIHSLQDALANIRRLHGLLPICASCKKIRDDEGYWNQLEIYIQEHSEVEFTHGICPECMKQLYGDFLEKDSNSKGIGSTEGHGKSSLKGVPERG